MGMSWTEVHEEAEHLEHAVSERLIDRMDEMLGRPAVDPHGDPIPDSDGIVSARALRHAPHLPAPDRGHGQRVSDQDPEFLRFVERHDLRPGQIVEVEERERRGRQRPAARRARAARITIGARAASKVLVQAASLIVVALAPGARRPARAQTPRRRRRRRPDEPVRDRGQLVPRRRGVQPGARRLPEHLRRARAAAGSGRRPSRRSGRRRR